MYSNCLLEAIKAKIKDPKNVKIDYMPRTLNRGRGHFLWINYKEEKVYHYHAQDTKPFWNRPLFNGKLKVMELRVYEGFILKTLYDNNYSVEKAFRYTKKHRLHITKADVEEYFYYEKNPLD